MAQAQSAQYEALTKVIMSLVLSMIIGSGLILYNRFFMEKDFMVSMYISCNPEIDSCFVNQCDSEKEICADSSGQNENFYKKMIISAQIIPDCNGTDCPELDGCPTVGTSQCEEVVCDVLSGDECSGNVKIPKDSTQE